MSAANTTLAARAPARAHEETWSELMRAGLAGDAQAYSRLLKDLTPKLRALVRRGLSHYGAGNGDAEDIVQEVLLAVHLKRHTWQRDQPFTPWLNAIARYKLIDVLRRRGRRAEVPIDGLVEFLSDEPAPPEASASELVKLVATLPAGERAVVSAISLNGATIKDAAKELALSEGAVRVALHRGLKRLARLHCNSTA